MARLHCLTTRNRPLAQDDFQISCTLPKKSRKFSEKSQYRANGAPTVSSPPSFVFHSAAAFHPFQGALHPQPIAAGCPVGSNTVAYKAVSHRNALRHAASMGPL